MCLSFRITVLSFCVFLCVSVPVLAVQSDVPISAYEFDQEDVLLDPVPVTIIPEDAAYPMQAAAASAPDLVIGDTPPEHPLFYGSGWITGTSRELGRITIYWPITYQDGYWGLDSNGYLYNVSAASLSGYLDGVYNNSASAPAFSYPRYRSSSGSSYTYVDLHIVPEHSNMSIATAMTPKYSPSDFLPYVIVLGLGVIVVCFMKRW